MDDSDYDIGSDPIPLYRFQKHLFTYGMMIDYLESIGIDTEFDSSLEVGGGQGTNSRVLKLEGRTESVDCIDINPYHEQMDYGTFLNRLKQYQMLEKTGRIVPKVGENFTASGVNTFGYYPKAGSTYQNINSQDSPTLNEYIVDDFENHDFQRRYDFVFAFQCIEYFDLENLFEK